MNYSQEPQVLPRQCLLAQPPSSTPRSQTAQPSSSRQMLPLQPPATPTALLSRRDRPSVSQHQDVASGGHSTRPMSSDADLGQPESHTNAAGFPGRIVNSLDRTQGQRRGATPVRGYGNDVDDGR